MTGQGKGTPRTSTLAPAMSPAIPIDIQRAIRRLEDQSNRINTRLDEHAEQLQTKLGSSTADMVSLAQELRTRFQASGSHPISLAGLPGEAAQPQKAAAPSYTTLPLAASMGALAVADGKLYRYGGAGWTPFGGSSSGGGTGVIGGGGSDGSGITVLVDTHGARQGYVVSTLPDGSLYFETDRNVFYIAESGAWVFAAGVMVGTIANRPADLAGPDAGFVYAATDTLTEYEWNGTAWITIALANTVRNGTADPDSTIGNDGDFYLNTTDTVLFGPKSTGAWPTPGVSLIGPVGPAGATGATGPAGTAATIAVGTVTTGAPGSAATVTNAGTSSAAVFDFAIPQGEPGSGGGGGSFFVELNGVLFAESGGGVFIVELNGVPFAQLS